VVVKHNTRVNEMMNWLKSSISTKTIKTKLKEYSESINNLDEFALDLVNLMLLCAGVYTFKIDNSMLLLQELDKSQKNILCQTLENAIEQIPENEDNENNISENEDENEDKEEEKAEQLNEEKSVKTKQKKKKN